MGGHDQTCHARGEPQERVDIAVCVHVQRSMCVLPCVATCISLLEWQVM